MLSPGKKTQPDEITNDSVKSEKKWYYRVGRPLLIFAVVPYVVLLVLIAIFQRQLIYHPHPISSLFAKENSPGDVDVQDIEVPTAENLKINGWLFSPVVQIGDDQKKHETLQKEDWLVLFFPGNAGNRSDRISLPSHLTGKKMHVILCDYRGYADNPGSPNETALCADAEAIWNFAIEEKGAVPERIIVYGESLGGGVAVHLTAHACRQRTPPAGLVLSGTFSSMADAAGAKFPYFPVSWLLLDQFHSKNKIENVTCPITQIHGTADQIVPLEIGKKLFNATPAVSVSGIKKQFIEVNHAGHNNLPVCKIINAIHEMQIRTIPPRENQ